VAFELTIPVFQRSVTTHALYGEVTEIGGKYFMVIN